jgi:hypothetical protein
MTEKIKVAKTETVKWNPVTGKYEGKIVTKKVLNPQDLSIDEFPPPGVEGPLSKTPPQTLGGVTSAQIEKSRQTQRPAGIEESLPAQDKD